MPRFVVQDSELASTSPTSGVGSVSTQALGLGCGWRLEKSGKEGGKMPLGVS